MPIFRRSEEPTPALLPSVNRGLEQSRPHRYLVLGSEEHGRRVTSHRWDRMPDDINVADYDVVVLNFAAFEDKELAEGFPTDRLPSVQSMTRLLFSPDAEIIAIGNPSTLIGAPQEQTVRRSFFDPRRRSDYWLPFYLDVQDDSGTSYRLDAEEWAAYFEHLSGWRWIATGDARSREYLMMRDYLEPVTNQASDVSVVFEPIATTRYEKMIALRVRLWAIRYTRFIPSMIGTSEPDVSSREVVVEASPVFWLPAPDRVSPHEVIDTILRERYGIAQEARIPEWAAAYSLPNEAPIASEIAELEQDRRELEER